VDPHRNAKCLRVESGDVQGSDIRRVETHIAAIVHRVSALLERKTHHVEQREALVRASGVLIEQERRQLHDSYKRQHAQAIKASSEQLQAKWDDALRLQVQRVRSEAKEAARADVESMHAMELARERKSGAARLAHAAAQARDLGRSSSEAQVRAMSAKLSVYRSRARNAEAETKALRALRPSTSSPGSRGSNAPDLDAAQGPTA